jgi:hypothetical protein
MPESVQTEVCSIQKHSTNLPLLSCLQVKQRGSCSNQRHLARLGTQFSSGLPGNLTLQLSSTCHLLQFR